MSMFLQPSDCCARRFRRSAELPKAQEAMELQVLHVTSVLGKEAERQHWRDTPVYPGDCRGKNCEAYSQSCKGRRVDGDRAWATTGPAPRSCPTSQSRGELPSGLCHPFSQ
ncbi:uncharacterized protein BJX67DRAFT_219733 [Aspergillus lucknowensis]|uniref:Uncharacterized protein n=1 Tax=Aspergillus lucknowensis TaxID=176173 RepID=A0ABR4LIR0_9EURO